MKKLFLLAGVVAAMISCSKNEVSDLNVTNPDVIAFDTYVGQTTKGTIFDQSALKASGFGLMAYYTGQETWDDGEGDFAPDFMYNQSVIYNYDSSVWSYDPIKYWPNEEFDKVTFFSYAPYESSTNRVKGSYTSNTAKGLPQVWMKLKDYAVNMVDFVAGQNMDMVRQQEKVTFMLKHQLTRATFSAKTKVDNVSYGANASGDGASFVVVKSMDVIDSPEFYTEGVYTFDNETTDDVKTNHDQDGTWEVSEPADYSFESIMAFNNTEAMDSQLPDANYKNTGIVIPIAQTYYTSLFTEDQYLFLLPPNGAEGLSDEGVQVEIVYDIVTIDSKLAAGHSVTESTYVVTLPAATLAQGKAYNYQLEFDVTEILVRAEVVDWDNVGGTSAGIVDPFDSIDIAINTGDFSGLTVLDEGKEIQIKAEGDDAADIAYWGSSDDEIASVDEDGLVTLGGKAGTATITAYDKDGNALFSFKVVVADVVATDVEIVTSGLTNPIEYVAGATVGTISATTNGVDTDFVWSTSPAGILNIDSEGNVTLLEQSTPKTTVVTITATDKDGVSGSTTVTVVASSIASLSADTDMTIGENETISVKLGEPSTYSASDIAWSTSNGDVATVENGVVTAVGAGSATITATLPNGATATLDFAVSLQSGSPAITDAEGNDFETTQNIEIGDYFNFMTTSATASAVIKSGNNAIMMRSVGEGTGKMYVVNGLAEGTATIEVSDTNLSGVTTITVNVSPVVVSGVTISGASTIDMAGATSFEYTAEVSPENAADKTVTWAVVSGPATIDNGILTPTAVGSVVISATAGNVTVTKEIKVTTSATVKINFDGDSEDNQILTGSVGLSAFFNADVTPNNVSGSVVWSANNDNALTINSATGEFEMTGSGYVTITATVAGAVDTLYVRVSTNDIGIDGGIVGGDKVDI